MGQKRACGLADDAHDVGFLHDQVLGTVDLDFRARPLAEQDPVALLDVEGNNLAACRFRR